MFTSLVRVHIHIGTHLLSCSQFSVRNHSPVSFSLLIRETRNSYITEVYYIEICGASFGDSTELYCAGKIMYPYKKLLNKQNLSLYWNIEHYGQDMPSHGTVPFTLLK